MKISIFWFRRDLRLIDNTALHYALESGRPVKALFIFDENIIEGLAENDARLNFIYEQLQIIHEKLTQYGTALEVMKGKPENCWKQLIQDYEIDRVYINRDYEPYAIQRDKNVEEQLSNHGIELKTFKDQVIFEAREILKEDGEPYVVYTPYRKKWESTFISTEHTPLKNTQFNHFYPFKKSFPTRNTLNIKNNKIKVPDYDLSNIKNYTQTRDYPSIETSRLGPHLRFGTVSIRQLIKKIGKKEETFKSELIWREFFMQILFHYPKTAERNFKSKYDGVEWRNDEADFNKWCEGKTGYPIVDAGMRQLNETGFMHNRLRMITAGFLCKHLLIHWSWGEAYFAQKLLDYELASNVGNWQWAAGTGVDAAPYFRIFNPITQTDKFDKDKTFIKKWLPEYGSEDYPEPMVDHKVARERCLKVYKKGIGM
ncbi:MAG: deoxyribodipyrimidine photo-lyase [Crocinitomicaceae bacterium]